MADSFYTILQPANGLYKEKGSRFLAFAEPVETEQEAKQRLAYYRKEYYDARHVCYAWMLGADREQFRQSDDGEPSGTAGRPILGQINSRHLTNILIVVVRYFGGILLGTGGLVVAYKEAASDALANAQIVEKDVTVRRTLRFNYEKMNNVMRTLKDIDARIISQDYENDQCVIVCDIKKKFDGCLTVV
ncbi:MAG: YigZ family protein [Paludibacteraceae bacterium]|nr:YigZ family protein [Paludibacteraceae bacterium]